jgi:cyclophilin family peptidyl-prolyl cis-trans isomerase
MKKNLSFLVAGSWLFVIQALTLQAGEGYATGLYAEVLTNKGMIVMQLEFEKTPLTVASFVGLAEGTIHNAALPDGTPYFDGTVWNRVVPGHVIQCGIPRNGKAQNPGYEFPNEIRLPELNHNRAGMVNMGNDGPNTNGSEWCIMLGDRSYLDGDYTVFGHVVSGLDVVFKIVQGDAIERVEIVRVGPAAEAFRPDTGSFRKMAAAAWSEVKAAAEKKRRDEAARIAAQWPQVVAGAAGLRHVVVRAGTGETPKPGDRLTVSYTGSTLYGKTFAGMSPDGLPYWGGTPQPFGFDVGKSAINPGFDATVAGMRRGEKRIAIVPASQAYGSAGFYARQRPGEKRFVISPDTLLVYEIELLEIRN